MHLSGLINIIILGFISTLFFHQPVVLSAETQECTTWLDTCAALKSSANRVPFKACIGDSIFYYSPITAGWSSARFYCTSVFNGIQSADLLYLKDEKEWTAFGEFVRTSTMPTTAPIPTSALCCIRTVEKGAPKKCFWPQTSTEMKIGPDSTVVLTSLQSGQTKSCSYLTLNLGPIQINNKFDNLPFAAAEGVNTGKPSNFVCSFSRPGGQLACPNRATPKPPTPKPPTPKPVTPPPGVTTTKTPKPPNPITVTTPTPSPPPDDHSTPPPGVLQCTVPPGTFGIAQWPAALPNTNSTLPCPEGTEGEASWLCGPDGHFIGHPLLTCSHTWLDPMKAQVEASKDLKHLTTVTDQLGQHIGTKENDLKFHGDLKKMVEIIQHVQTRTEHFLETDNTLNPKEQQASVKQITRFVVKSCSKMLSHDGVWRNGASSNDTVDLAEHVLRYIQYAGVTFGCSEANADPTMKLDKLINSKTAKEPESNIYMSAFNMDHQQPVSFSYNGLNFSLTNSIDGPDGPIDAKMCNHKIGVGAVFDKLSQYLSFNMTSQTVSINSEIIAFNYNNKTATYYLPKQTHAQMILTHNSPLQFGDKPTCVFWDFTNNSWSSEGCWVDVAASSADETVCVCNHLTSFSVLMDVSGRETPSQAKNILTIVCTSASVVCLVVTIALFWLCRELQNRRTTILVNLSISLIAVDLLVLFGLDQTSHPILCKCISAFLLYALLASFSWMLMEGYQLYQMVILVFNNIGHLRLVYLYLIGYGVPLLMTVVSVVPIHLNDGLTNEYFCWITSTRHPLQILALVVPATIVILINTVIMYLVLKTVFKMKFGKSGRSLRPATSSSSPSKSTSSSASPIGGQSNRQRNITLKANASDSSSASSVNSKKRLFEKSSSVSLASESTRQTSSSVPIEKQVSQCMSYVKGYVSLIVLMGITWITYVLYIHQYGHFFSYVFIVLNGLQGVFIFITQFVFDNKTYGAVKKRFAGLLGATSFLSMSSSSSTTKNTVSSSYTTSTPRPSNAAPLTVMASETDYSAYQTQESQVTESSERSVKLGQVHFSKQDTISEHSSSSGTSSLSPTSELASIFKEHYNRQRKLSLEYF